MYITGICDNEEQLLAHGFETGKAAGLEEGFTKAKQILRMYNDGKTPDEIATLLDISVEQVNAILES